MFDCPEPSVYGEPLAVVVTSLLHVVRKQTAVAQQLVADWRTLGPAGLKASHFEGLAKLTGATLFGSPLTAASAAASDWLVAGTNKHVPDSFSTLYERYFIESVWDDPEGLSYLGLLEEVGIRGHNRVLSEVPSAAHTARHHSYVETDLELLTKLEATATPDAADAVSNGVLRWILESAAAGAAFKHHAYALDQMDGVHLTLQLTLTDLTPIRCLEDGWNYVSRLTAFPSRFSLVAAELRLQATLGILPPKFVVTKVLSKVRSLQAEAEGSPESCALYTSIVDRLTATPESAESPIVSEVPLELKEAARAAVANQVASAYGGLVSPLEEILTIVSAEGYVDHSGVQALPNGAEYYAWCLREQTSTRLSPEQVHRLGESEVARIMGAMAETITRLAAMGDADLDGGESVPTNMQRLAANPRWLYEDTAEGKEKCLSDFRALVPKMEALLASCFDVRPNQPLKIVQVPPHMEEGSPAAFYMPPSLDGARDGVFYVNTGDMAAQFKYGARTLYAHEAIPGHHFQLAIQMEMEGLPYFRKTAESFNAFVEGWALYTERLARELGFFATEADDSEGYDLLGHFGDELMRAARLVVDTGLHYYGWSRDDAIKYMETHTILAPSDIVTEVERYCVLPGQATSYKVGQLELLRRRDALKEALGEAFNPRLFHRLVLQAGAIPLDLLPAVTHEMEPTTTPA